MDVYDTRTVVDFQKFTFSGHLRAHVYKVLDENIKLGHADYSCYWALELLCSGLVHSMWETLFESAARHINRGAPNCFLYLVRMYEKFAPYETQYPILEMTNIRNNHDVRTLICEVAASLALCKKNKLPSLPKIKPEHDFLQLTIQENLKVAEEDIFYYKDFEGNISPYFSVLQTLGFMENKTLLQKGIYATEINEGNSS